MWDFSEKLDGTNMRIVCGESIVFKGKTDRAQIPAGLVESLITMFHTPATLVKIKELFAGGAVLYGEGVGPKIQKGGGLYGHVRFILFDVRVGNWWLRRSDVESVARDLGIECAPLIGSGTLEEMVKLGEDGFTSSYGDFIAEGIVARPSTELFTRSGHRVICKIKHKDFL
jgi:hypothetical protein